MASVAAGSACWTASVMAATQWPQLMSGRMNWWSWGRLWQIKANPGPSAHTVVMSSLSLPLSGLSCASCVARVEKALRAVPAWPTPA
jgi:hypothetical protein